MKKIHKQIKSAAVEFWEEYPLATILCGVLLFATAMHLAYSIVIGSI